ncbi:MAG TPA: 3-hydroxybutyryl-CoA dehydratase [Afipia sp.]|nr:3-hydroxybutyryl-CoA dehydratase [Afipia sp.]
MTSTADIQVSVEGGIGVVRLCRPAVRNAVTLAMWQAIAQIFGTFGADENVRAVILTGEQPDFSVGADIGEFSKVRATVAQSAAYEEAVDAASAAIEVCPKPVIAAVSGYSLGGACHLAMACDFRFAHPDTRFGIPAARLSIVYGVRSTDRLRNLVGLSNAKRILYSAEQFDGLQAQKIGFADHVSGEPLTDARAFAERLQRNAPLSISGAKLILNGLSRGSGDIDDLAKIAIDHASESEDYEEGRNAFAEKRPPVFLGR